MYQAVFTNAAGSITTAAATLTVTTPFTLSLSNPSVLEFRPIGTPVGTFSSMEAGSGHTFTYSLVSGAGSTDNASFTLGGSNGDQLLTQDAFNATAQATYSIRVQTTDEANHSIQQAFTITVTADPNLSYANRTLKVLPTAGNNTFTFTASATGQHTMTLNGVTLAIDTTSVDTINFASGGGGDTVTLTGVNQGNDFAEFYPHIARFAAIGNAYTVNVGNAKNITVTSSGPNSLTYFHTSDTYTGSPLFSEASDGSTYTNTANGFVHNDCFGTGSTSKANLTTSTIGADEYGGVPTFSFVQGPNDSYDCYAVGFAQAFGTAGGNTTRKPSWA